MSFLFRFFFVSKVSQALCFPVVQQPCTRERKEKGNLNKEIIKLLCTKYYMCDAKISLKKLTRTQMEILVAVACHNAHRLLE